MRHCLVQRYLQSIFACIVFIAVCSGSIMRVHDDFSEVDNVWVRVVAVSDDSMLLDDVMRFWHYTVSPDGHEVGDRFCMPVKAWTRDGWVLFDGLFFGIIGLASAGFVVSELLTIKKQQSYVYG